MNFLTRFYRISSPVPRRQLDPAQEQKLYKRLRLQAFIAATLGYSLYYVCRTSLNVMKKPILDSGSLDASQLGVIGSALLFAYAVGKFVNGFIADYCNIKRFMATGLIVSAAANMLMGVLGLMHSVIPTAVIFIAFAVMWGLNGWSQSMGAAPAIISLSRWYPLKERGTYYGFFSASHNLGEFFSFLFVGSIVTFAGWQAGFFGSAIAGAIGVVVILLMLHDTPESKGLPPVEALAHEKPAASADKSVKEIQKQVLRTPAVWILAAASAFMYISRYAINGWGVLFLQEDIADRVLEMLQLAMGELAVGNPARLATDVGPVIDEAARAGLLAHIEGMRAAGRRVFQYKLPDDTAAGCFVPPTLIEIDSLAALTGEVFGPVVHVLRYAAGSDGKRILDDLRHLLKSSQIG